MSSNFAVLRAIFPEINTDCYAFGTVQIAQD